LPAPVDEFGVKPENMFYNKEVDRFFCLLDAPNKEAIQKTTRDQKVIEHLHLLIIENISTQ
jgi:hypothetical protein